MRRSTGYSAPRVAKVTSEDHQRPPSRQNFRIESRETALCLTIRYHGAIHGLGTQ